MTLKVNVALSRKELYALNDLFRHVPQYEAVRELHDKVKVAIAKAERLNNERAFREENRRKKADDFRKAAAAIIEAKPSPFVLRHTQELVSQDHGTISGRFTHTHPEPQDMQSRPKSVLVVEGDTAAAMARMDLSKLEDRVIAHYADEGHLVPYEVKEVDPGVITSDMSNAEVAKRMNITERQARILMFPFRYGNMRLPSPKDEYLGKKKR